MRAALVLLAVAACWHAKPRAGQPPAYTAVGVAPDNAARATPPPELAKTALPVGATPRAVPLRDQDGDPWSIASASRGSAHLVLVFYRGDWCPYCRAQLADLQAHLADFGGKGAALAAISVDSPDTSTHLAAGLGLTFRLVSDPGHRLIGAFGVFDGETELAWPAVYILDARGAITWRWLADDFKTRITSAEILAALTSGR